MHNAFLVIRTVFFALLIYFHVLVLVFASWNIAVARSSGMSAPGASVFLLMNSTFIFVLVPMAYLAELICARARPAHVRVECAWTVLMTIFQLAASIGVTVNGSSICYQLHLPWAMCASSSLLVHISWLVTLIILSYCLTICVVSATHAVSLPDIWITPVPHVPWFRPDAEAPAPMTTSRAPIQKHAKSVSSSSSELDCAVSKYIAERWEKLSRTERQPVSSGPILPTKRCQSVDPARPAWARLQVTRRGIDDPFVKLVPQRREPPVVLAPPPRTRSRHVVTLRDSHSVEVREWRDTRTDSSYLTPTPRTSNVFPQEIINPDLPIPRPSPSKWVHANVGRGITVHTKPIFSP